MRWPIVQSTRETILVNPAYKVSKSKTSKPWNISNKEAWPLATQGIYILHTIEQRIKSAAQGFNSSFRQSTQRELQCGALSTLYILLDSLALPDPPPWLASRSPLGVAGRCKANAALLTCSNTQSVTTGPADCLRKALERARAAPWKTNTIRFVIHSVENVHTTRSNCLFRQDVCKNKRGFNNFVGISKTSSTWSIHKRKLGLLTPKIVFHISPRGF